MNGFHTGSVYGLISFEGTLIIVSARYTVLTPLDGGLASRYCHEGSY